jgi:hypothetical protein
MFKGGIEVFSENGSHATSNAVEHRVHFRHQRQPVVEVSVVKFGEKIRTFL